MPFLFKNVYCGYAVDIRKIYGCESETCACLEQVGGKADEGGCRRTVTLALRASGAEPSTRLVTETD